MLTDGVDDAAVYVASAIEGGQVSDGLPSQTVLQKEKSIKEDLRSKMLSHSFWTKTPLVKTTAKNVHILVQ